MHNRTLVAFHMRPYDFTTINVILFKRSREKNVPFGYVCIAHKIWFDWSASESTQRKRMKLHAVTFAHDVINVCLMRFHSYRVVTNADCSFALSCHFFPSSLLSLPLTFLFAFFCISHPAAVYFNQPFRFALYFNQYSFDSMLNTTKSEFPFRKDMPTWTDWYEKKKKYHFDRYKYGIMKSQICNLLSHRTRMPTEYHRNNFHHS